MNTRARQGLGWAVLGAALWGSAAVLAVMTSNDEWTWWDATLGVAAMAGVVAGFGGLFVAAIALIRNR